MRRLLCALMVALCIPLPAAAIDLNALLAQIEALKAQIVAMQQGNGQNIPVISCDLPTKTMRRGDSGVHVSHLQEFLARDSAVYPEATVSGYYGSLTVAAVQRWQIKKGIVTSGTAETTGFGAVGPRTLAAMKTEWCLNSQLTPVPFTPAAGATLPGANGTATNGKAPVLFGVQIGTTTNIGVSKTLQATSATSQNTSQVLMQAVPRIMFTSPTASTTVTKGGSLAIVWKSDAAPLGSSVKLSLLTKTGQTVGVLKNGMSESGTYYWSIPLPAVQTSSCTSDPITCLAEIANISIGTCEPFCNVPDGLYKVYAQLFSGANEVARAESRIFSLGGVPLSIADLSNTGTYWDYSSALYATTTTAVSVLPAATSTTPLMCTYSGVQFTEGISVEINCADVTTAGQTCGSFGGTQLTCRSGKWVDKNGVVQNIRNVTSTYTPGSCITPWMAQVVANGNQIPREPFFTNGVYASTGATLIMRCTNGNWQTCDTIGDNCR